MSDPLTQRVRELLGGILTAVLGLATGSANIIAELRFIQRGLFGLDSAGGVAGDSIAGILADGLKTEVPDGGGGFALMGLASYLKTRLLDPSDLSTHALLLSIIEGQAAQRGDLLHDGILPPRTLGQQVESVRFLLTQLGSTVENIDNVLLGLQSTADRSSLLLSQVAPLAEGNDIYSALISINDHTRRSAECCEEGSATPFPELPAECAEGGALVAIMYPASNTGTAVDTWDVQIQAEGANFGNVNVSGTETFQYVGAGSTSVWFYVQMTDPDDLSPGGGAWGLSPVIISDPPASPGRPEVSVNSFGSCTSTYTLYAESTVETDPPITYRPYLDFGLTGAAPTAANVRILVYSSDI